MAASTPPMKPTTTENRHRPTSNDGSPCLRWHGDDLHQHPTVSGAWRPGQPSADRQFMGMAVHRPFVLGRQASRDITIAFATSGELSAAADNAILVCHALTGDAHATGPAGPGQPTPGWWSPAIGPGKVFDTDQVLRGLCRRARRLPRLHRPGVLPPRSAQALRLETFPVVSIRDLVHTQAKLADVLGIERWPAWWAARWAVCRSSSR